MLLLLESRVCVELLTNVSSGLPMSEHLFMPFKENSHDVCVSDILILFCLNIFWIVSIVAEHFT